MITLIVPTILPEIISAKCDLNLEFVQCALLHFLIFTTSFLVAKLNFASAGVFLILDDFETGWNCEDLRVPPFA